MYSLVIGDCVRVTPKASNSKAQGRGTPRTLGCRVARECHQTPTGFYTPSRRPFVSLQIIAKNVCRTLSGCLVFRVSRTVEWHPVGVRRRRPLTHRARNFLAELGERGRESFSEKVWTMWLVVGRKRLPTPLRRPRCLTHVHLLCTPGHVPDSDFVPPPDLPDPPDQPSHEAE